MGIDEFGKIDYDEMAKLAKEQCVEDDYRRLPSAYPAWLTGQKMRNR